VPNHGTRELVIAVPLPEDRGRRGDGRPKVHRFRSRWLELGRRLREFRARYGLTQGEIAAVVGAGSGSAVAQRENGVNVPDGLRRERLTDLLAGRLWPALRAAALVGDELPSSWERAVRWYRRASRYGLRIGIEVARGLAGGELPRGRSVPGKEARMRDWPRDDGTIRPQVVWRHRLAAAGHAATSPAVAGETVVVGVDPAAPAGRCAGVAVTPYAL
jgi:transcriptional regulator with XRE-family HTH domain